MKQRLRETARPSLGICVLLLLFVLACAQSAAPALETSAGAGAPGSNAARDFIRTASLRVAVDSVSEATSAAIAIAESAAGHVQHSSTSQDSAARLQLRVPAERLESVLDQLGSLGEEISRNVTANDVTEELSDLNAELANNEALRDRLRHLLQRAETVKDVLAVEAELTRVQVRIDSLAARLKRMRDDVALSAIDLALTPSAEESRRILGPLGMLYVGTKWFITKLFVIRP